jgi:hypothetical protein
MGGVGRIFYKQMARTKATRFRIMASGMPFTVLRDAVNEHPEERCP